MFAALENLIDSEDITETSKNNEDYIKTSAKQSLGLYGLKQENHGLVRNVQFFFISEETGQMQLLQEQNQGTVD
jgi:hypothetical protein